MANDTIIDIDDLHTHLFTDEGVVRAVDGVSFSIRRGETLCVVGESGCGKSMTARSILQIVDDPGRIVSGSILFRAQEGAEPIDIAQLDPRSEEMRHLRGSSIAMIFQEPMTALSPVHTVGNQIVEAMRLHLDITAGEAHARTVELLRRVGVPNPERRIDSYPFELSGGMRQRVCIAMALSCRPQMLIADEPTTALDVTTQANILDLMRDLQSELGMSMMFITHDLGVVAEIADEVVIMYLGIVVERGDAESIFFDPKHPYTRALLESVPRLGADRNERLASIPGMVPHPFDRPSGCPFHTRCDYFMPGICDAAMPAVTSLGEGREVRCYLYDEAAVAEAPSEEVRA